MFYFKNWDLSYDGQVLAMQFDNLTRTISLQGDLPDGWDWVMEVGFAGNHDIIQLAPVSGGLEATLTRDNLAFAGWYEMQLRGNQGDLERRTNIIRVHVPRSLSGDAQWPTLPTEFSQAEQRIADLNAHPSIPGQNGFWLVWDPETQQYKESEYPLPDVSVGPAGKAATIEVAETVTGEPGSAADVVNIGDENAARLRFTIPRGQTGPVGATPQISVTVETLPAGSMATVEVTGTPEAPEIHLGIPQGAQGERGQQGIQGVQGWSVSAAALDDDGALVLTIRNPADGSTQQLPPVPIDNSAALQAVVESITDQGTTQVQRVETAGSTAVGEVSTAKDAALQAVGQAQTTATGAVSSVQTTAVQAVQDAQGIATEAIGAAQTAAVAAVEAKGTAEQEKLNAIVPSPTPEDAGKALVVNEDGTGLKYDDLPGGAGIDDAVIATNSTWSSRMVVDSLAPAFSETGSVVTCNPVAGYPLSIQAQIVPVQEGSGDPSPDNVRPISGKNSASISICGVNLWDNNLDSDIVEQYPSGNGYLACPIKLKPNTNYVLYIPENNRTTANITFTTQNIQNNSPKDEFYINLSGTDNYIQGYKKFLTGSNGYAYINVNANTFGQYWDRLINTVPNVMIYEGADEIPYEPHHGQTITIPFGQTIYGGTLDVVTGMLTVTQAEIASYNGEDLPGGWISDRDMYGPGAAPTIGAQVVYELAEPQIIQLTPQEILALSGVNTIYADTGNVIVSGRADPNAVIQQLAARIAALESAAVDNA